jgi:hypothetical protein
MQVAAAIRRRAAEDRAAGNGAAGDRAAVDRAAVDRAAGDRAAGDRGRTIALAHTAQVLDASIRDLGGAGLLRER